MNRKHKNAFGQRGAVKMFNFNSQVNFATNSYNYNPSKSSPAKTETEKSTASRGFVNDGIAVSQSVSEAKAKTVQLSSAAENYLEQLRDKYKDYDIMIADYSSQEEASELLSKGEGSINVLITPDVLEKMATDEKAREHYESVISGAQDKINEMTEALGENAEEIEKIGFTVDAEGKIDYYAMLTALGGKKVTVKESIVEVLAKKVDEIAEKRKEAEERKEKLEEAVPLPPESFEKYRTEQQKFPAYAKDEDYGNLPPESFEKYRKEEEVYPVEEDYGNLPPESFKKYQKESMDYSV